MDSLKMPTAGAPTSGRCTEGDQVILGVGPPWLRCPLIMSTLTLMHSHLLPQQEFNSIGDIDLIVDDADVIDRPGIALNPPTLPVLYLVRLDFAFEHYRHPNMRSSRLVLAGQSLASLRTNLYSKQPRV